MARLRVGSHDGITGRGLRCVLARVPRRSARLAFVRRAGLGGQRTAPVKETGLAHLAVTNSFVGFFRRTAAS